MAVIRFNANEARDNALFNITLGNSHRDTAWTVKRSLTFRELAELLWNNDAPIGRKDGACYTPALFAGTKRLMDTATQIDVAVLDSDCGHSLDYIREGVESYGWRAIIHSTYSHMSTQTPVEAKGAEKWLAEHASQGCDIASYLVSVKGFVPEVAQGARIADDVMIGNVRTLIIEHNPCPKFRVVLPLDMPWIADNYDDRVHAFAAWRQRLEALAYALGLQIDKSCSDVSRLFYLPRRKNESQPFEFAVVPADGYGGSDCPIWTLPDAPMGGVGAAGGDMPLWQGEAVHGPETGNAGHGVVIPFTPRTSTVAGHKLIETETGETFNLTEWAAKYANHFEIVKALRERANNVFSSRQKPPKYHVFCPNGDCHHSTTDDGTGAFCVDSSLAHNAGMPSRNSGFIIHCKHNGCADKDRLDHLSAFIRNGALSIYDLTDRAFLHNLPNTDNVARFISKHTAESIEAKVKAAADENKNVKYSGNIPEYIFQNLPGPMGIMHRWILETSPKPQPLIAFGALLAFSASVIGQRVAAGNIYSNIYIFNIAFSGTGKDRPMKACKELAAAAGLEDDLIGVEEFASDAGIVSSVARAPRQLMLIDEVSGIMKEMRNARAPQHIKNIYDTLLKLFTSSNSKYKGKSYRNADETPKIDHPCVSLYANTVPDEFYKSLKRSDLQSGFMNRVIVFDNGKRNPVGTEPSIAPPPQELIDWVTAWNNISPYHNVLSVHGGERTINPLQVMITEEGKRVFRELEEWANANQNKMMDQGKSSLYQRLVEYARKFALIFSCASVMPVQGANGPAIDTTALRIDKQAAEWGRDLAHSAMKYMESKIGDIVETDYEELMKTISNVIRNAGPNGLTDLELNKRPEARIQPKVLADIKNQLASSHEIARIGIQSGKRGRPRTANVHKDYFEMHMFKPTDSDNWEEGEKSDGTQP